MKNNKKQYVIEKLEEFKTLISDWDNGHTTSSLRSEINKKINFVKEAVVKAGTLKTLTIAPPPAIGGLVMKNVDPFQCIFESPYNLSVIPIIIDSIDEAIGVIETIDIFRNVDEDSSSQKNYTPSNRVFIVHGRDNELKDATARFLEKLGLVPIILHEQSNKGKTIIEKFEEYSDVVFAIILMTPDDQGAMITDKKNIHLRARQNVVFELGYFIGKLNRNRVAAIVKGDIEIPTDIHGILYIGADSNGAWKMLLAKELKDAGLKIDLNKAI